MWLYRNSWMPPWFIRFSCETRINPRTHSCQSKLDQRLREWSWSSRNLWPNLLGQHIHNTHLTTTPAAWSDSAAPRFPPWTTTRSRTAPKLDPLPLRSCLMSDGLSLVIAAKLATERLSIRVLFPYAVNSDGQKMFFFWHEIASWPHLAVGGEVTQPKDPRFDHQWTKPVGYCDPMWITSLSYKTTCFTNWVHNMRFSPSKHFLRGKKRCNERKKRGEKAFVVGDHAHRQTIKQACHLTRDYRSCKDVQYFKWPQISRTCKGR